MGRVMLISMPLSVPHYPSLALGLLKPALEAIDAACDIRYFSIDYVESIGADAHACLTHPAYYMAHVGEWVFSGVANGQNEANTLAFLTECFATEFPQFNSPARLSIFLRAREAAAAFIETCFAAVNWPAYAVVGFSTSYQQTMASLALARRIKQSHPDILIAFGGVNCQDAMGRALLESYDCLDAVCLGEGDHCFPEWIRRLRAGLDVGSIPGMAVRDAAHPVASTDAVADMDRLPYPDYDDFFAQHAASPQAMTFPPVMVFETARGCWWGERQHCTFCGLNGTTMRFRAKSAERAFEELAYLVRRHDCTMVANADKILDERYFDSLLPRLADSDLNLLIYYEVKVGLTPEQMGLLARAGVRKVQFGIETFDTALLRLMAKGITMLQNIEVLKLAAEAGIYVEWLALSGFPGEQGEQYDRLARLLPQLFHLQPPAAFIRARADRFSPYERHPERYHVLLEPLAAYQYIFPFESARLRRLANHFTLRSPDLDQHDCYVADAAAQYARWQAGFAQSGLWLEEVARGHICVHDRRAGADEAISVWEGAAAALLEHCWRIRRWHDIVITFADRFSETDLADAAAALASRHFMIHEGTRWLTLAMRPSGPRRAPIWSEILARPKAAEILA